jgi:hypothetical protein
MPRSCAWPALATLFPKVLALVGKPLLEPRRETLSAATLGLRQAVGGLAQLMRMGDFLPRRQGEEVMEARVDPNCLRPSGRNGLRRCVDEQTEVPARGAFDEAATFDPPCGKLLGMEPHMSDAGEMNTGPLRRIERIRKGDARQFVPLPCQSGLLCEFLIAACHAVYAVSNMPCSVWLGMPSFLP